jgi:glycosyltransferase involved in cell wall biosynthesis
MKVLWFTNTPANADESLNIMLKGTGGWLKSLDKELQNVVELHIAFFHSDDTPFKYKKTLYHPIKLKISFYDKLLNHLFNVKKEKNHLEEFLRIIKIVQPDIIHIHGTELTFGEIISNINIPIVLSIQGNITVYKHMYFSGIDKNFIKKLINKLIINKFFFFKNNFLKTYELFKKQSKNEQLYFLNCKNIIGRTAWDKRISAILSPNCNYFHCDEILRDSFYIHNWHSHDNRNTILHTTTGNSLYKGFETLCYSLYLIIKAGYAVEWHVAGLTETDLIVKLVKRKLGKYYPSKGLVFLGNLKEDELVHRMLESDLYVMPSHIENSPNSLCEAMILGLPCIASFAGGTGSILTDHLDGILVQPGDPWALGGAIIEFIQNPDNSYEFGKNARKRALVRHNKERIIFELVSIYKIILSSS